MKYAKRQGYGKITYKDGGVYEGAWIDDRPFDKSAIEKSVEYVPEKLETFGMKEADWKTEYKDLDVREGYSVAGFKTDDRILGFIWKRDWDNGPGSKDYYSCGLRDESKSYYSIISGIRYQPESPYYGIQELEYQTLDLVERDEKGRIVFCGVHKDGVRHGLGSEFSYVDDKIIEIQGLWQNGM